MDPGTAIPASRNEKASGHLGRVRFDALEAALLIGCVAWLLPQTFISRPVERGFWLLFNNLGISQALGPMTFYFIGLVLHVCLVVRYLYARFIMQAFPPVLAHFNDAFTLFSCLYPLDFFISTASPFIFVKSWWPFFALAAFFFVALYFNRMQAIRMVHMVALVTGIQACCAIYFYFTGQHQYYTPHFGNRTNGTFASPNTLYPLCLLGAPLCLAVAGSQKRRGIRILFTSAAAANLLALTFTYMRSGWLGLAAAIVYLLVAWRSVWVAYPWRRAALLALLACVVMAVLLVRTKGDWVGTAADRSTLGRFQIWRVCWRVIEDHPWLGSGLSSYQEAQDKQMTPALRAFNPMNGEAKSLYLNVTAEFGFVGLVLLCLVAWQYARCIRATRIRVKSDPQISAVLIGTTAGMIALAVAGLTDTPILNFDRAPGTFALAMLMGASAAIARDALPSPVEAHVNLRRLRRVGWSVVSLLIAMATWTAVSSLLLVHRAMPPMDHYVSKLSDSLHPGMSQRPPGLFEDALLAAEDRNFYLHHGIDWEALHSALRHDLRIEGATQGGSTITMQAVRYSLLSVDKTPARKIAEMILANRLETRLSKIDILRLYCDSVGFGLHAAGLTNAARIYFAKQPRDLSLAECAFLVGVISHPPQSNQELTVAFTEKRKLSVLRRLEQTNPGKYDPETLENARRETLKFAWDKVPNKQKELR